MLGKKGKKLNKLENQLGLKIDIEECLPKSKEIRSLKFDLSLEATRGNFSMGSKHANKDFDIYTDSTYVFSAKASKDGKIKLNKDSEIGEIILDALDKAQDIKVVEKLS